MKNSVHSSMIAPAESGNDLLAELLKQEGVDFQVERPIGHRDHDIDLPLSSSQQRLWFLHQMEPDSALYNVPTGLRLTGQLHLPALEEAFNGIVVRHEALRTIFRLKHGAPVQLVQPAATVHLPLIDLQLISAELRGPHLQMLLVEESLRPFDLTQGPLLRVVVYRLSPEQHVLLINMHHIVSDGWSIRIFMQELAQFYSASIEGRKLSVPALPIQYADYALWERNWINGPELEEQLAFWKKQLAAMPTTLELPTARRRVAVASHVGAQHDFYLPPDDIKGLQEAARKENATLFIALLSVFQVLLFRYTNQEDIVVGSPVSGRTRFETEPLIGFFMNTLALRTVMSGNPSFRELLKRVKETVLAAFGHQEIPFEKIVEELHPDRALGQTPLFQTVFTFESKTGAQWSLPGLRVDQEAIHLAIAKFDLALSITETTEGLFASFEYATDLFDCDAMLAMESHYRVLLHEIAAGPDRKIAELGMLSTEERSKVVEQWNSAQLAVEQGRCLHHLFTEQAHRTPFAPAVIFEDKELTYNELDCRANQLAHFLVQHGVVSEARVAICMERSLEMVISILAVLKAGAAYVPIGPDAPKQRTAIMLQDSAPNVVLTQQCFAENLPRDLSRAVICVDHDWPAIAEMPERPPEVTVTECNTAYVMYTSGSTGTPKGVANEHRGVLNCLRWLQDHYPIDASDRVLQKTPYTFDVSVPEFFWTWMTGACLVIARPGGHKDPAYMVDLITSQAVTSARFVPSMLQVFLEAEGVERCTSLKMVICTGEILSVALQERFFQRIRQAKLINAYGPTEAAVEVSAWQCHAGNATVPIGGPAPNTQFYILDPFLNPVPVGIPGELFIAGIQVARGYLNRPHLTAEKFIPDPFAPAAGARMYRTGDLARWRSDGAVEFLGRLDFQVKLRGFRIELGEIESVLMQHGAVLEAVVAAQERENGDKYLVAYFTAKEDQAAPVASELKSHLEQKLPDYMVPTVFVPLGSLPRGASGKVDRKSLPVPGAVVTAETYVAPHTPVQQMLCDIWAQILNVPRVGIHDDFFQLGGHSLLAIRVLSRMRDALKVEVPLQMLFAVPTIAHLAQFVDQQRESGAACAESIPRLVAGSELPLSYNQEGRLLLEWFSGIRGVQQPPFHAVLGLDWAGDLDFEVLETAINQIIQRHQALRTSFVPVKGKASLELLSALDPVVRKHGMQRAMVELMELAPRFFKQVLRESAPLKLQVKDIQHLGLEEKESEVARVVSHETHNRFDYERPPLMRVVVLKMEEQAYRIIITVHHIVTDVWSMDVLTKELFMCYRQLAAGNAPSIPDLPIQHSDFAAWQRDRLQGDRMATLAAYWRKRWQDIGLLDVKELGCSAAQTGGCSSAVETSFLDPAFCGRVKVFTREKGITTYMLFLGGLYLLLHAHSGKQKIGVWGNFANRTRTETENLIGWLVNSHLLGIEMTSDMKATELLDEVRDRVLEAHSHQEIPFSLLWARSLQDLNVQHHTDDKGASPYIMFDFHTRTLNLENTGGPQVRLASLPLQPIQLALHFVAWESDHGTEISADYALQVFPAAFVRRLLAEFEQVLDLVVSAPETPVSAFRSSLGR